MDVLSKKTLGAIARVQVALALMLFASAWSLDFWQAWLYWSLSTAALLVTALHFLKHDPALMRRRLEVGARAEPLHSQKIIQGIGGAFVAAIYIVAGVDHRFGVSSVASPVVLIADLAVLASFWTTFRVFRTNTYTASTVTVEAGQRVIDSGPYAAVRHPMYTAAMLGYLATPLALRSVWALVPGMSICAVIVVRLLDEERHLRAHLPGYEAYCSRVRDRLIPRVW